MIIKKLSSRPRKKGVTLQLSYEEIRDIANGFYYLTRGEDVPKDKTEHYKLIYAQLKMIFDIVKHGNIMPETVNRFYELAHSNTELDTENQEVL